MKVIPNADGTISIDRVKGPSGELRKFEEDRAVPLSRSPRPGRSRIQKDSDGQLAVSGRDSGVHFPAGGVLENKYFNFVILYLRVVRGSIDGSALAGRSPDRANITRRPLALAAARAPPKVVRAYGLRFLSILFIGWAAVLSATDDIAAINSLPRWVVIFGMRRMHSCVSRNDSRCDKCVAQLAHRRQVDLGQSYTT